MLSTGGEGRALRTRLHSAKFPICEREKPKELSAPTKQLQTKADMFCKGLWDLSQADRQTWQCHHVVLSLQS